ncbi:methyl-accepting chemotaxis protein [Anaerotignum sp.]|uniref:methyl-accepting chemotaxis protein n=1 Tax=Anaerotignum sp. TaxID=2039241 RepID=UPI00331A3E87
MKFFTKSIVRKMILTTIVPSVIMFLVLIFIVVGHVKESISEQSNEVIKRSSISASWQISQYLTDYMSMVETGAVNNTFKNFMENVGPETNAKDSPDFEAVMNELKQLEYLDTTNIQAAWIGDLDSSQLIMSDGYVSDLGGDWEITERAWYISMMERLGVAVSEPYIDQSTQKLVVTIACPVYNNGKMVGAYGVDMSLDQLTTMFSGLKLGETGYYCFVTRNNTVLYHPKTEYVMQSVSDLPIGDEAENMLMNVSADVVEYDVDGQKLYGFTSSIGSTGWKVVSAMPSQEFEKPFKQTQNILFIFISAIMLVICAIIYIAARNIVKPLRQLANVSDKIAEGDLDVELNIKTRDETSLVANSFNKTVVRLKGYIAYIEEISELLKRIGTGNLQLDFKQNYDGEFAIIKEALVSTTEMLNDTLSQISVASQQVASGSDQVSSGAQALSQGATEQASSIEELSATMNDISSQIKQTAENATKAKAIAQHATTATNHGQEQMQLMVEAMEEISRTSNEIGKIIKNIDDIAFQTNILALNAAVEAARAGSAGRGFAVVADEVRNLASKSAESAKNTSALIESALHAIEKGTLIVNRTANSLEEIVHGSEESAEIIQYIANASNEQAQAITQVNLGVEQISAVVQTNSATAEEEAAASEELSAQAQLLQELLSRFTLKSDVGARETFFNSMEKESYEDMDQFDEGEDDFKY